MRMEAMGKVVATIRSRQGCMKYARIAKIITPSPKGPKQPPSCRQAGVKNSIV